MAKKIMDKTAVEMYFRKGMYTKSGEKYTFNPASKVIDGWKNKTVTDIVNPLVDLISRDFRQNAKSTVSNRTIIGVLSDVCKAIGLDHDIQGDKIQFLACDANVIRHEFIKISATEVNVKTVGSGKILKTTLEVIGKRYRRKFYTVNGEIK